MVQEDVKLPLLIIEKLKKLCLPVRVWKQWSLKTSVSSISIPELPTSGDSCEPIANNLVQNTKTGSAALQTDPGIGWC